jgi:ribonucleoside-diphosphate reductase alpha chain
MRSRWRAAVLILALAVEHTMSVETLSPSEAAATCPPRRERLPDTRQSITHKFNVQDNEGYVTVGLYPDGRPGELFIKMAKQGSTISGLMDTIGVLTSLALQYGVPVQTLADKFAYMRFEPSGWTSHRELRHAHSLVDYIFRWLGLTFGEGSGRLSEPVAPANDEPDN